MRGRLALLPPVAAVFIAVVVFDADLDAAARPVGTVDNAVMLHARLSPGMPLLSVVTLAHSLGRTLDGPGEAYEWQDASGDRVVVHCARGRCTGWQLLRHEETAD